MLEVGKIYTCKQYSLLLYPDQEAADAVEATGHLVILTAELAAALPATAAAYLSKQIGKPVSYCDPETPLLVLNIENDHVEVLAGDKRGWIINQDWLEIEEIG